MNQPSPPSLPQSPLAGPRLWNCAASNYVQDVAPGLSLFAKDALQLAAIASGMRVADVACGPGDLSLGAARAGCHVSSLDFSSEMVALLRERAVQDGLSAAIDTVVGDGMELPWSSCAFDAAFSMFGVIFFPDRARGLRELVRVLRPGGRAVVSSWVPADRVPILSEIWRILAEEIPNAPYTRVKPPLGDPREFRAELEGAGFAKPEVHEVEHHLDATSALDYWQCLARSTPPMLAIREGVTNERWAELSDRIGRRLETCFGSGPQRVPLIALLGVGTRSQT